MESSPPSVPTAAKLVHLCEETIQGLEGWYWSLPAGPESYLMNWQRCRHLVESLLDKDVALSLVFDENAGPESYLMNRQQCEYLVERLSDTDAVLQKSPVFDENASLALQELHGVLQHAESLIKASYITTTPQLLRAALEQGDMKETFSKLLYDVQWHTRVLQSFLVVSSGDHVTFDREMCNVQLGDEDESHLLKANKEDEKSLKDRLGSLEPDDVRLDVAAETEHAKQVLIQLKTVQGESSSAVGENGEEAKGLPKVVVQDPRSYFESGEFRGQGGFGVVRKTKFLGGKYAVKIIRDRIVRREMLPALKLGHHPNTVSLLCYSEGNRHCYLIMEEMQMPLTKLLDARKLSNVEAVDLMLQIAEGIRYLHSKGMAHRDLKPGNVLVNLAEPSSEGSSSRICSVKIADYGSTKIKDASRTCSNQTLGTGTMKFMAPEVIRDIDDREKTRYNPRKADAYSFSIMCYEILTGEDSTYEVDDYHRFKEQVKAGTNRPELPERCSPRLASLIQRCWAGFFFDRPLFPEICRELRYIKGLLLRDDRERLEIQLESVPLSKSTEGMERQGPWGSVNRRGPTFDYKYIGTCIKRIKLGLDSTRDVVVLLEIEYIDTRGDTRVEEICAEPNVKEVKEITLKPFEYITRISGSRNTKRILDVIGSLTIHTDRQSYGPYGKEGGELFESDRGRIIGLFGTAYYYPRTANYILDSVGVYIIRSSEYSEGSEH